MSDMSKKLAAAIRMNPKPKFFEIAHDKLADFVSLQPRQYELLISMIERLRLTHEVSSFIGTGVYKDFGYKHRQGFHRDKKVLEELGFIVTDGSEYFVRLDAVMYTSKRNYNHILTSVGAISDPFKGFMGNSTNVPPPPPSKK